MSDARAQAERELLVVFDKADLSELAECATAMQRAGQILDAFAAEQTAALRGGIEQVAKDCEEVTHLTGISPGERRTWKSVAASLRALLATPEATP